MCYYFASTKKYYPLEFFSPHFVAGQQHHNSWVAGKPHIIPIPSSFKRSPGTYRDMGKLSPPRFERVFEFFIFGYLWNLKDLHIFYKIWNFLPIKLWDLPTPLFNNDEDVANNSFYNNTTTLFEVQAQFLKSELCT